MCYGTKKRRTGGAWKDSVQVLAARNPAEDKEKAMKAVKLAVVLLLLALPTVAQVDPALSEHWKYEQAAPLNIQNSGTQERGNVKIYDLAFLSPVDGRSEAVGPNGGIVSAYLVVPAGKGPFPAV